MHGASCSGGLDSQARFHSSLFSLDGDNRNATAPNCCRVCRHQRNWKALQSLSGSKPLPVEPRRHDQFPQQKHFAIYFWRHVGNTEPQSEHKSAHRYLYAKSMGRLDQSAPTQQRRKWSCETAVAAANLSHTSIADE